MDVNPLRDGYLTLLAAAAAVADADPAGTNAPDGEWNADQILAHIALVDAATISAAADIAAGVNPIYDNRISLDTWTIARIIGLAGGNAGLRERIRRQGIALVAMVGEVLSEAELDTLVPTRLLSGDAVQLDQPMPFSDLVTGIATAHLPQHAEQLLALLPISEQLAPA